MRLKVIRETSTVVFNSSKLQLHVISLATANSQTAITQTSREVDEKAERVTVQFSSALSAGSEATLFIEYEGTLDEPITGYYRSTATFEGKTR